MSTQERVGFYWRFTPLGDGSMAKIGDIVQLYDVSLLNDKGYGPDNFPRGVLGKFYLVEDVLGEDEDGEGTGYLRVRALTAEESSHLGSLPTSILVPDIGLYSRRFLPYDPANRVMKFMGRGAKGLGL